RFAQSRIVRLPTTVTAEWDGIAWHRPSVQDPVSSHHEKSEAFLSPGKQQHEKTHHNPPGANQQLAADASGLPPGYPPCSGHPRFLSWPLVMTNPSKVTSIMPVLVSGLVRQSQSAWRQHGVTWMSCSRHSGAHASAPRV